LPLGIVLRIGGTRNHRARHHLGDQLRCELGASCILERVFAVPAPIRSTKGFALPSSKPEFWAHRSDKLFDPSAAGGEICALTPACQPGSEHQTGRGEFQDWTFYPGPNAHHQAPQSGSWVDRSSLRPFDEQARTVPSQVEGPFQSCRGAGFGFGPGPQDRRPHPAWTWPP
jgi:hypothetical protein